MKQKMELILKDRCENKGVSRAITLTYFFLGTFFSFPKNQHGGRTGFDFDFERE